MILLAEVVKLVNTAVSKTVAYYGIEGSNPSFGTILNGSFV